MNDLTGQRFGSLMVLSRNGTARIGTGRQSSPTWTCRCDCGVVKVICGRVLRRKHGPTVSCGCRRHEGGFKSVHGMSRTPTHNIWLGIIRRCTIASDPGFRKYGGAGIGICPRWRNSFADFYADMGPRPSTEYSIDRIDGSKGYEPGNCRWATDAEQANNTRRNVRIEYHGLTKTLAEWMKLLGLPYHTIKKRFGLGWSADRAFTEPIQQGRRRVRADHP